MDEVGCSANEKYGHYETYEMWLEKIPELNNIDRKFKPLFDSYEYRNYEIESKIYEKKSKKKK